MFLIRYQVRFGLLQAAHYGTPQSRVRFFMIASKANLLLPAFPIPTHEFPIPDAMEIKPPAQAPLRLFPSLELQHTGLYAYVSIKDAIEDLPYWDWQVPFTFCILFKLIL